MALQKIVELVGDGWLKSATLNLAPKGTAKISMTSKGKIKVTRTQDNSCSLE